MIYVVKLGMRQGAGDHVFEVLRFVIGEKNLGKMQKEYPWPLEIINTFPNLGELDLARIRNRWLVSKVEGKEDWFYAFPTFGSWISKATEEDIRTLTYPKII